MGLRYKSLCFIARHEWLFRVFYTLRSHYRKLLISRRTQLVIEGFPRCANTFAVLAFESAQGEPVRLAHHLHAQVQLRKAVQWGIPALVLIREPIGAVASLITRHPDIAVNEALEQYRRFYGYVATHRNNLVIADFREVTTDYVNVIHRLNRQFGTAFIPYINSEEGDELVFAAIDRLNRDDEGGNHLQLARPSDAKKARHEEVEVQVAEYPAIKEIIGLYNSLVA